ncbi:NADPH:quinone reductase [Virgisporangium aliadipatigenens]|uniref:NADPH:quinone reductase n=1 Tax=Virgisporangium aliadipatigenens TaxID=741659 RepID=A0A8J3YUV6_9ACTN|nr:NAD(P)-dependent alcohol dehydrogenase [Virgisporangium aliadipatigenens]GIJ50265.1 NADPH:quinone reductase [Virgisporangium aliadipatigenens]
MRAIVRTTYCAPEALRVREVDRPVIGAGEVLVRVRAASVNPYDLYSVIGSPYLMRTSIGLRRPKLAVPGVDLAGEVEAVGPDVTGFARGDAVFGMHAAAFAEFAAVPVERLVHKPPALSFVDAAATPLAALTAFQGMRKGGLREGQRVLVNGASGGVGTFAVQLARAAGATVTAVCSTRNVAAAHTLGARHVIDYRTESLTGQRIRYDLVLDIAGTRTLADWKAVAPEGTVVFIGGPKTSRWVGPFFAQAKVRVGAKLRGGPTFTGVLVSGGIRDDLSRIADLLTDRAVVPMVERTYALEDAAEALRYIADGHARAKVVLTV